ncbi:MAG: dioxygenase [Labilithrix sp.]|nr:dioxygenase [Labilithrix sp.]
MAHVPPIFVSHGMPALAIDAARGAELSRWASDLPRPRGILVVSAHWSEKVLTRGSTARRPELRYDFGHTSEALFRVAYGAPGAPDLAYELHSLALVERSARGWDHGVWTPLVHMYPNADVPILQLSLVEGATPRQLFAVGRKVGALAARGVLILGSGGVTHNLAELEADRDAPAAEWAREFDGWVANLLADAAIDELVQWRARGPHAQRAHPTSEHLDPLFVVAGAASLYDHAVGFPLRGFEHATLSRRCVQFGR